MILPDLTRFPVIGVDVETTGLTWFRDRLFGVAFAWMEGNDLHSLYVDIRKPEYLRWAKDQIERAQFTVGHNYKFDVHFLREAGIRVDPARIDCTMIREALLDEHRFEYSLNAVAREHLDRSKDESIWERLAQVHGGKSTREAQIGNLQYAPEEWVTDYARPDAELALQLRCHQERRIQQQELHQVLSLERRLLGVVIDLEHRGVRVDLEEAAVASRQLGEQITADQAELNKLAGWDVNVNSGPQVQRIVQPVKDSYGNWQAKDGTPLDPTDGGGPSMRTHALHNMRFREAGLIASIRGMIKARDVFVNKYVLGMSHKGYIHASINQTKTEHDAGTGTGRFSITEPALQQIHARDKKMAKIVRSLFLPDPGQRWGSFDYSQIDMRCFAHYANVPKILAAYAANPDMDLHAEVAKITGLPRDRDEKTGGANAKQIDLGLTFGMGEGRLAREMGLQYYTDERGYLRAGDQAREIFARYHAAVPGIRRMLDRVEAVAKERGYIWTPARRRLRFPNPAQAYKAGGLLFQAAAAEIIKVKMIEMHEALRNTESRLMLSVHDELCISMGPGLSPEPIVELMQRFDGEQTPMRFRVPIRAKAGIGDNWYEATKKG